MQIKPFIKNISPIFMGFPFKRVNVCVAIAMRKDHAWMVICVFFSYLQLNACTHAIYVHKILIWGMNIYYRMKRKQLFNNFSS